MNTAAFTAVNASLTAQSAAQASAARDERCKVELVQYDPKHATVAEMQSYAACVQRIHPVAEDVMGLKALVATLLICALIGAVIGAIREQYDRLLGAVMGAFAGASVMCLLALAGLAVVFVFS